ncbi:hypothetical protein HDV00_001289 [Rhizophlyctis rosea]|nr:hypothetical protein HDV00_001289 [Rhizophlyctis rosea]
MSSLANHAKLKIYQWEVTLGLYMLEPWEKVAFNTGILLFCILSLYTAISLVPNYAQNFLSNAYYYTFGATA